jgi:hypothetical protein
MRREQVPLADAAFSAATMSLGRGDLPTSRDYVFWIWTNRCLGGGVLSRVSIHLAASKCLP